MTCFMTPWIVSNHLMHLMCLSLIDSDSATILASNKGKDNCSEPSSPRWLFSAHFAFPLSPPMNAIFTATPPPNVISYCSLRRLTPSLWSTSHFVTVFLRSGILYLKPLIPSYVYWLEVLQSKDVSNCKLACLPGTTRTLISNANAISLHVNVGL